MGLPINRVLIDVRPVGSKFGWYIAVSQWDPMCWPQYSLVIDHEGGPPHAASIEALAPVLRVVMKAVFDVRDEQNGIWHLSSPNLHVHMSGNPAPAIWRALQALNPADYHVTVSGDLGAECWTLPMLRKRVEVKHFKPVTNGFLTFTDLVECDESEPDRIVFEGFYYGTYSDYAFSRWYATGPTSRNAARIIEEGLERHLNTYLRSGAYHVGLYVADAYHTLYAGLMAASWFDGRD